MTEIVNGKYVTNELSASAKGGTEQMAHRMVRSIPTQLLQGVQIIHSRVREIIPGLKHILVCHDLPNDPEVAKLADPEYRKQFDKIVFVSDWQAQMYNAILGIPYSEFVVIRNAIEPFDTYLHDVPSEYRFIYHTTPHRGLDIAYNVIDHLTKEFPVHLDVYSSFSVYGWQQRDQPYQPLFEAIKKHPNMTYHGGVENSVIRAALNDKTMNFFLYPSTWMETSCIAAIEAMAAGVIPIVPNLAALPETCHGIGPVIYQFHEDKHRHMQACLLATQQYLDKIHRYRRDSQTMSAWANEYYNWNLVVPKWNKLLTEVKNG